MLATGSLLNLFALLSRCSCPPISDCEEVDTHSLHQAAQNIQINASASTRVQLLKAFPDQPIFACLNAYQGKQYVIRPRYGRALVWNDIVLLRIDFAMCNPPFYESAEEMQQLSEQKDIGPSAVRLSFSSRTRSIAYTILDQVCTGAATEMVTKGGEVAFVSQMVQESQALPQVK